MKKIFILILSFFCMSLTAQTLTDSVALRAMLVGRALPQERVYLHFDNDAYYLGENIWFKAFVTSHNDDRATNHSKVLYVELVAPEGYVVKTQKYKIEDDGTCNGEIFLDPLYLSGYYEVRAYTRYMLNWGAEVVFSRVFPVFDKVDNGDWGFCNILDRRRGKNERVEECKLVFFPEGGHLVYGLKSRVAYELTGSRGKDIYDAITILADGKELLTTTPVHMGKGDFFFTPQEGIKYKAVVKRNNEKGILNTYSFSLPKIEQEGVVITLVEQNDSVQVDIASNYTENTELGFLVTHRNSIGFYKKSNARNLHIMLPKENIPEGVSKAVVFNGETPLAERLFYVRRDSLVAGDKGSVKLKVTEKGGAINIATPKPYEKIEIEVGREDGKSLDADCNFAVSVIDNAGIHATSWGYNLQTYQLLGSELKGYIANAHQYFDPENEKRDEHLDLVMLTHGWTAYDWSKLVAENLEKVVMPEKGLYIRGKFYRRLVSAKIGELGKTKIIPQPYNQIRLDYSDNFGDVVTTTFRTDNKGRFTIEIEEFEGKQVVALSPRTVFKHSSRVNYAFSLDRYFSPVSRRYHYAEIFNTEDKELIANSGNILSLGLNEYLLNEVEIKAKKQRRMYAPPLSELRLDYLDEWEYANDVTYLQGPVENEKVFKSRGMVKESVADMIMSKYGMVDEDSLIQLFIRDKRRDALIEYENVMSANDVLKSAIDRHFTLEGWLQPVVVKNYFCRDERPVIDEEYLHGVNIEKMTNFKELVITSDRDKCSALYMGDEMGYLKSKFNDHFKKGNHSIFYDGFLTGGFYGDFSLPAWLNIQERDRIMRLFSSTTYFTGRNNNPDHLACFIPYNECDSLKGIVPDLSVSTSTRRYTSLQGYTASKQFYSPDYSKQQPDDTDFRRTLLWQPSIKPVDGKLQIELYNNSTCKSLSVKAVGYNNGVFYSNDYYVENREPEYAPERQSVKTSDFREEQQSDSVFWNECKREFDLAEMYFNQRKYSKSIVTYAELVQYNYLPAFYRVGCSYLHGLGLKQDLEQALVFFKNAAEKNHPESQYEYAMMIKDGKGCEASADAAVYWLEKSAAQECPEALEELGRCYLNGVGTPIDSIAAKEMFRKAALHGKRGALYHYAMFMLEEKVERDEALGTPLECIISSADKGCSDALRYLMYYYDALQEYKSAYSCAFKLYQIGNTEATKYLADCYFYGRGVKKDKILAKELYHEAGVGDK